MVRYFLMECREEGPLNVCLRYPGLFEPNAEKFFIDSRLHKESPHLFEFALNLAGDRQAPMVIGRYDCLRVHAVRQLGHL